MKYFNTDNFRYAFKVHQQQTELPYLLLQHGFMGDHRVFNHLIDDLCSWSNPITIDLLGHGDSSKPTMGEAYTEHHQVEHICSFIHHLSVEELFLYGYSMGGRLALKVALQRADLLKGLILESTNCGIPDEAKRKERQKTDKERAKKITTGFNDFLDQWQQLSLFKSPNPVDKQLKDHYTAIQHSQSPEALAASLHGFGTGSMVPCCDKLCQINLSVLLIAGSADEKYERINKTLVQKLPNAHFSSLEGGHRVHVDNAAALSAEMKLFMYEGD